MFIPGPTLMLILRRAGTPAHLSLLMSAAILFGCGTAPQNNSGSPLPVDRTMGADKKQQRTDIPALPRAGSGRGGYYQDDGPGDDPPEGLLETPDAEPKVEPYLPRANRPYVVLGKTYTPISDEKPFKQRGIGSWYGKKFHGQKTSSGEIYDMYKMTAAHPTLPIPSYARVTNLANGKQVIVRVNDRGPFHSNRIIDLSYTAALKLGYLGSGSGQLEVERLLPEEVARINAAKKDQAAPTRMPPPNAEPIASAAAAGPAQVEMFAIDLKNEPAAPDVVAAASIPASTVRADAVQTATQMAVTQTAAATASPGFYLQFGAYSQAANAAAARDRLRQSSAVDLPPFEVVEAGLYYRIFSGPFASKEDAAAAARRMQEVAGAKPMIVQR